MMLSREEYAIEELQYQVSVLDSHVAELKAERDAAHAALQKATTRNAYLEAENIRLNLAIRDLVEKYERPETNPSADQGAADGTRT